MERKEGAPRGQEGTPPKERARPKRESELSKLLDEKRLFAAWAPKRRDPESYPIEAMKQIQAEVAERIQRQYDEAKHFSPQGRSEALDQIIIDKLYSLKVSIDTVEQAYGIITYPFCKDEKLKRSIKEELEKANDLTGRDKLELNEEELEVIGKMTRVRRLPFDPEKRIYEYSEVPDYTWPLFRRHIFR